MRRFLPVLLLALASTSSARAQGLLIPSDKSLAPLAMVGHEVHIAIEDQVAVTRVVQTFRNSTDRALEATYIFPVPKGASVHKFTMWVNGKEVNGELVEANKARTIYTDIVRRTQDPGLLEYMDSNLLKLRVFPVPAHGDQKVSLSYTAVAQNDAGLVEVVYPLRTDKNQTAMETFSIDATLTSQHPIQSVYSPSHAITVTRKDDRHAKIHFEKNQATVDKDFQLFYTSGAKDVGLTAMFQRPVRGEDGHFMLLISPRAELSRTQQIPRDMVFVLDTSGSMQGKRIEQARAALKFCLGNLNKHDRFGLIHFATTVTKYQEELLPADRAHVEKAKKWVSGLEAVGSTNIDEALATALAMRPATPEFHNHLAHHLSAQDMRYGRSFTVVFFTDGQPTIGECNPEKIVQNAMAKNTADTRIFTFGVGDDVNAVLLDQLADKTRSVSTYVRESEDIEAKVSSLYSKISKPVLTNLKLKVDPGVKLTEVYPPQLPDLFHGSQLVVLGKYSGKGPTYITLTGMVGKETREFAYEVPFPARTKADKAFVEGLWARRKVGYLLDQIRANGENKELVQEVIRLAKKHGITTPYTSYLVAPDATPAPVAQDQVLRGLSVNGSPVGVDSNQPWSTVKMANTGSVNMTAAPKAAAMPGTGSGSGNHGYQINGGAFVSPTLEWAVPIPRASGQPTTSSLATGPSPRSKDADEEEEEEEEECCGESPAKTPARGTPLAAAGKEGVDLSLLVNELRTQSQVSGTAIRNVAGRNCRSFRGAWIDEAFKPKMTMVKVKAQSDAYFRLLERQPKLREVFQLGNRVIWVTPSGTALVIDVNSGQEQMSDEAIDRLFRKP
jgi:Ca-activated chloride channel family protein